MGSLESLQKTNARLRRPRLIEPSRAATSPHVENSRDFYQCSAQSRNKTIGSRGAQHCIFASFSRRAPTHPLAPGEPARRSPAALRLRAAAPWGPRLGGKNGLLVEKKTRPNGAPTL